MIVVFEASFKYLFAKKSRRNSRNANIMILVGRYDNHACTLAICSISYRPGVQI